MSKEIFVYQWILDPHETKTTIIRVYGIDSNQKTICLKIKNFKPYCFIQLPNINVVYEVQKSISEFVVETNLVNKFHLYNSHNSPAEIKNGVLKQITTPFLQTYFENSNQMYKMVNFLKKGIIIQGKKVFLQIHETYVNPILQLVCVSNIETSGWLKFKTNKICEEEKETSCDEEYIVRYQSLKKGKNTEIVEPKILSFDMEVNSSIPAAMPSDKPNDLIFQISCVISEKNKSKRKILLSLEPKENCDNMLEQLSVLEIETLLYESECDLLIGFIKLLNEEKPNVVTGFNIFGFDLEYSMKRAKRLHLCDEFKSVSFFKTSPAKIEEIKWSSSAYKNQSFNFINWEGILLVDLLPIIQRDYKLDTYSLKNVSSSLLNNNTKDPVSYKDIFQAFRERDSSLMVIVGKYCVQDSDLCIELMNHLHTWVSLSEMAKCCNVPMFVLYTQGQQIRVFSQVYRYCNEKDIIVTTNGYEAKINERFRGALVHEPEPGYYKNVCPLDFASLYPSIIIGYNLCYSTFIPDDVSIPEEYYNTFEWEDHVGCEHDESMIKVDIYTEKIKKLDEKIKPLRLIKNKTKDENQKKELQEQIKILVLEQKPFREKRQNLKKTKPKDREDADGNKLSGILCAKRCYRFLKPEIYKGVVPSIIQNLLDSRAKVRQLMKTCAENEKIVFDKEQLSYKVSANSFYGSFGVTRGYLAFMPCAMTITFCGRKAISNVIEIAQKKFSAKLIMSDTDSTYIIFPKISSDIEKLWNHASNVAYEITNWKKKDGTRLFPDALKLEFENVIYSKFLILAKKMYLYKSTSQDGIESEKIGKKGVVLARRDNSQAVRTAYENITKMIFEEKSVDEMKKYLSDYIRKMFSNELKLSDFIITKSIGETENENAGKLGDYKIRHDLPKNEEEKKKILGNMTEREYFISQCPAQVQLAEKMKKRGIPVSSGSRIEYVVLKKPNATLLGQRIESFDYFFKYKEFLYLDYKYYSEALINPISQLFNTVTEKNVVEEIVNKINEEEYIKEIQKRPCFVLKKT
jgi:DNA polymerase elongation subunit (family B)